MKKRFMVLSIVTVVLLQPLQAMAWNATGHKTVARIAWSNMTPEAKKNVIALLKAAPKNSGIRNLLPPAAGMSEEDRNREFFVRVATWPDIIRGNPTFHRSDWHFINFFFEQSQDGTATDRDDLKPPSPNAVEQLEQFNTSVVDENRKRSARAVDLAWVVHLVGDIHQPLHCSARVTETEPEGDRGGNLFKLDRKRSLHSFWDGVLDNANPKEDGEEDSDYIDRLASSIATHHPKSSMDGQINPGQFEAWAKEGHEKSKANAYPATLKRNRKPSVAYLRSTFRVAEPSVALAGYRLADMLNTLFGSQ
jgi:S1/P1 Nuclease